MIEKVKGAIYRFERKQGNETSTFYDVVYNILIDRWTKSSTLLHCTAHSLNPRYYSKEWLNAVSGRVSPHKDVELSEERNKCLRRYFPDVEERRLVNQEFARFSGGLDAFGSFDSLEDRWVLDSKAWWLVHGYSAPILQNLALKLLGQPCSSSCCERNWSTYSFIHSMRRNKISPKRAEDLVFVHTNLHLLSRNDADYKQGESKLWDIGGDAFDSFDNGAGVLEIASLSLDEPTMETMLFTDDGDGNVMLLHWNLECKLVFFLYFVECFLFDVCNILID
ncbi:Dimer_Tnp_hAT domain-containing protein [Cephalotus follicularis]|uniref:Dimer_Tnp_hAT domain-containing protein n=1 Tax=Cephalotus follicularis TaxID=3775 RepID=A0A1Q3DIM4_CEPFO|nr:Dimer_Tnp_hAT domain-containing protein [Cephalotus follicularis]